MNKDKWKMLYIGKLVKRGMSREDAEENFWAGIDTFDFSSDPIDAADDELIYIMADADREMIGDDADFFDGNIGFK